MGVFGGESVDPSGFALGAAAVPWGKHGSRDRGVAVAGVRTIATGVA